MSQADASVASLNQIDKRTTQENLATFNWHSDPHMVRKPDYFLYLFNIGPLNHDVARPPMIVRAKIPACPKGQKYVTAFKLGNIVNQVWADADTGQPRTHSEYAERVLTDLINPYNLGVDQDVEIDPNRVFSVGNNLGEMGVFWSRNEVPTDEEMVKPRQRMEKFFRRMIAQGDALARAGKQEDITELMHIGADYFNYKAGWHTQVEVPATCPNCGEDIKRGVAYHKNSADVICVIDWDRSIAAGVKKASDRPKVAAE